MGLQGKTIFITGGSRGIGLAIALRAARDGARIAIAAKTVEPHPKLPGTIFTAAREIEAAGGEALPIVCDIRSEAQVEAAVTQTVERFGALDICINNASALSSTGTLATEPKRYDLMNQINTRGTFITTRACVPHLRRAENPHVLNIAPPLDMDARWLAPHVAYAISKLGMSLCTLGHAREFAADGIGVNSLWPLTAIDTAAVRNVLGGDAAAQMSRLPTIMADAAYAIFLRSAKTCTGNFFIDEEVLRAEGVTDLSVYAPRPDSPLLRDFFVPDAVVARSSTRLIQHDA